MLTENDDIHSGLDHENQHEKRDEDGHIAKCCLNRLLQDANAWDQVREQEGNIGALNYGVDGQVGPIPEELDGPEHPLLELLLVLLLVEWDFKLAKLICSHILHREEEIEEVIDDQTGQYQLDQGHEVRQCEAVDPVVEQSSHPAEIDEDVGDEQYGDE